MVRNTIAFILLLVILIFSVGKIEAALQRGDIIYRTSDNGYMYGFKYRWYLPYFAPGHNGIYVGEIKSYNDNEHLYYVVEALGWGAGQTLFGKVELNLLSEFVDSSAGQVYMGAKTWNKNEELTSKRRDNIVQIAMDQVGEGYDENFLIQKGPDCDDWTCVGLTEKAYESADTPDVLQYASCNGTVSSDCYGTGSTNYALDITPDGVANGTFTTEWEKSQVTLFNKDIFFPFTQYSQSTLKAVTHDLNAFPVSGNFSHAITPLSSCKIEVSPGGSLGPFTVKERNNSSSYYAFFVQHYIIKPDGTTVNFKQVSTGLNAGKSRKHSHYLSIPSWSELGTFTFGVKISDTSGNLIDNDSFEFTVVSGTSYAMRRSARKLKRLMRNPEAQVVEEDGWKVVIVPENNR